MGTLRKTEWTEKKIADVLKQHFFAPNSKKYEITNLYVYGWESDYLAVMHSGLAYEVEIKISRADFKNDLNNKKDKHLLFEDGDMIGRFPKGSPMPNYFYYAVPEGLVKEEEIPSYAGLIYVQPWGIKIVKDAAKLTDKKFDTESLKITDKFYYNMINWQKKYDAVSDSANEIKNCNKTIMFYDERLSEETCHVCELELEIKKLKDEIKRRDNGNGENALPA